MRVRREAVLLVATAVVVTLLLVGLDDQRPPLRGSTARERPELIHHRAPDLTRVLAPVRGPAAGAPRDLFVEPSDTRPLPALDWREPPRRELAAVAPPPEPGPSPSRYGDFLRRDVVRAPSELFAAEDTALEPFEDADENDVDGAATSAADVRRALEELGRSRAEEDAARSPAERAARVASYRRLYDWVQLEATTLFGSIENDDRFGLFLGEREDEPISFVQIDPGTGRPTLPGQAALVLDRSRVADFGLARTLANEIELRYRALDGPITPGSYTQVLGFAADTLEARHEVPRALAIAADLYDRLARADEADPAPRIGAARCLEAAFDLEGAFRMYRELLERFPHRPSVYVALADLEERCLLIDSALENLRAAVGVGRTSWRAHWALGRTRLDHARGEADVDEAFDHLATANRYAPEDAGYLATRVEMRYDLGRAHLRLGKVADAVRQLELARALDPAHQQTLAALVSCAVLDPAATRAQGAGTLDGWLAAVRPSANDGADGPTARGLGFDLLLALGLWELSWGDARLAREHLESAAVADPLRAPLAWRALSFLAETAGYPDEAVRYCELALEGDPTDAWAHYQRGRLYAEAGELDAGIAELETALERHLDFDDALLALADLLFQAGRYDEAARYLERASEREPERGDVQALRGLNALRRGTLIAAREAFEAALALDAADPIARGGLAWCVYRAGDAEEARIQLAALDDSRRHLADDDPYRLWAREEIARLADHLEKVEWTDAFERGVLRNGWQTDEGAGPVAELGGGVVRLAGTFDRSGRVRLFREYPASTFVSLEASVRVSPASAVRAGLFIAREQRRQHEWRTQSAASISRHADGALEVRLERGAGDEGEVLSAGELDFPAGSWVRLRIERSGPPERPVVDVSLDGIPVVLGAPCAALGRAAQPLRIGVFAEGDTGRRADVEVDDVRVEYREVE